MKTNKPNLKVQGIARLFILACFIAQALSCSKDKTTPEQAGPTLEFTAENGEYKVKMGKEIALEAKVTDATDPIYSWKLNGKIISTGLTCNFTGDKLGEYFVTFRVDAKNGSVEKQVKVTVLSKLPPEITMTSSIIAYSGLNTKMVANVLYAEEASYTWRLNGVVISNENSCNLNLTSLGAQQLTLKVVNADGEDLKVFSVVVLPAPSAELFFDDGRFRLSGDQSTKRLSIPLGKTLVLAPVISNISGTPTFEWTVDGAVQSSTTEFLNFKPTALGNYLITVTAKGTSAVAKVTVACVPAEGTYFRAAVTGSKAIVTNVFEFIPAPGQFTNFQEGSTMEQARVSVQNAVNTGTTAYVAGLGAFGGYFISGFDHSVTDVAGKADISISGNAFETWSEPGIVWVMQDENGNGLPDDTWYELKGSETGKAETKQRYAITYYKPSTGNTDVLWSDNMGKTGSVDYNTYHTQKFYFPMFITGNSLTLTGTCLKTTFLVGGIDVNPGFPWGYVDNFGDGSKLNFWIEDAIKADGTPANLKYIDFVKVHTGQLGKGVAIGEVSTEAGAAIDLNLK
ncbi:PKD-like domain-containing protein [Pedobacter sp. MC2016-24]|uniref:PKD-like domain-containing protein n=1 Tax=Pedobacter sp. MC2016-24 TaxID=2780090 RepID=UPI001882525D|nr:PKD-like domain-containing protein [Pedobacter sp. MC2016-24]MBE9600963.1 hypothetical protein [Pedobacter sp. MC2016-24]